MPPDFYSKTSSPCSIISIMSAMNTSLNTSGGFGAENGQNVTLEMDGTTLARSMTPYIVKEMKRLGFNF